MNVSAQNEVDALRMSQTGVFGTSRYVAMGGAFGALGGDLSVVAANPAGLGVYRQSELSFTTVMFLESTKATHYGETDRGNKFNVNFGNIGIVLAKLQNNSHQTSWVATQLAFTYNKTINFNNRTRLVGFNPTSSLLDHYLLDVQGTFQSELEAYNPFGAGLAWQTYLLNPLDTVDSNSYMTVVNGGGLEQTKTIRRKGGVNELAVSVAANYANRLYIGASLGFPVVKYTETSTYREEDINDTIAYLNYFTLEDNFTTTGNGINFKIGIIYRAANWIRIGAAFHTPTFYALSDEFTSKMNASFDSIPEWSSSTDREYEAVSPNGSFDYKIISPMRLMGNIAFVIGKQGLLSADYEWVDYSTASLSSPSFSFSNSNREIANKYKGNGILKIGTEWRFLPFIFRGGYVLYGTPFKTSTQKGVRSSYSLGFGIREDIISIDIAYVFSETSGEYYLYSPDLVATTATSSTSHQLMATFAVRF
ncbi:MAG: hypothetical protein COB85_05615 [Bacteroidetes bacterium]|nr:MAG: hypothetical protein COB85_05615 [Bacteroidota bacterium]